KSLECDTTSSARTVSNIIDGFAHLRGAFRYYGAGTGRWAGEGFQPQNLKRPLVENINAAVSAVSTGDYAHVCSLYPKPLSVVGDGSRPMIIAAPEHVVIGADFSSIESRILAWILAAHMRGLPMFTIPEKQNA